MSSEKAITLIPAFLRRAPLTWFRNNTWTNYTLTNYIPNRSFKTAFKNKFCTDFQKSV